METSVNSRAADYIALDPHRTPSTAVAPQACGGRIGSLRVELMHFNFIPDVPSTPGLGLRVLSMEVDDAHAAHAALVRRGVPVSGPPVEVFGVHMFFVLDPDGQGIEMCEYERGGPAWGGAYR